MNVRGIYSLVLFINLLVRGGYSMDSMQLKINNDFVVSYFIKLEDGAWLDRLFNRRGGSQSERSITLLFKGRGPWQLGTH